MQFPKKFLLAALSTALCLQQVPLLAAEFVDVLNTPSAMSQIAIKAPLNAIASAGKRLVTVGLRGHILFSDDAGKTWAQAQVPVSSDLTAVFFASPSEGWAVGHDGVVLNTKDSGATWTKQLDGNQTGKLMLDQYTALAATDPANEQFATLAADAQRMVDEGADKPFLDVWFANNKEGYIVGAFGMFFQTSDGGQNWFPANDKVLNPQALHLNAITGYGADGVIVVSEQGLVLRLDRASGMFVPVATPYQGTYFGVLANQDNLIIYGLRGTAYRSADGGSSWTKLEIPFSQAITAAMTLEAGPVFLFSQAGHVMLSTDGGATFSARPQSALLPISAAAAVDNQALVLVGARGVRVFPIE